MAVHGFLSWSAIAFLSSQLFAYPKQKTPLNFIKSIFAYENKGETIMKVFAVILRETDSNTVVGCGIKNRCSQIAGSLKNQS